MISVGGINVDVGTPFLACKEIIPNIDIKFGWSTYSKELRKNTGSKILVDNKNSAESYYKTKLLIEENEINELDILFLKFTDIERVDPLTEWISNEQHRFNKILQRSKYIIAEFGAGKKCIRNNFGRVLQQLSDCGFDAEWETYNEAEFGSLSTGSRLYLVGYNRAKTSTREILHDTRRSLGNFKENIQTRETWKNSPDYIRNIAEDCAVLGFPNILLSKIKKKEIKTAPININSMQLPNFKLDDKSKYLLRYFTWKEIEKAMLFPKNSISILDEKDNMTRRKNKYNFIYQFWFAPLVREIISRIDNA